MNIGIYMYRINDAEVDTSQRHLVANWVNGDSIKPSPWKTSPARTFDTSYAQTGQPSSETCTRRSSAVSVCQVRRGSNMSYCWRVCRGDIAAALKVCNETSLDSQQPASIRLRAEPGMKVKKAGVRIETQTEIGIENDGEIGIGETKLKKRRGLESVS
ncbi:hypothetical protein EVAR_71043_1 [Eumeta japonica]|uniref:Uncharacterized protein n=1 Tax=Eumeta variegata TaxID=151549 RepID=A0A4C2AH97_EUMVA|nr:hypothetical protein EVAR_71043_1 [Eumeta japonica]